MRATRSEVERKKRTRAPDEWTWAFLSSVLLCSSFSSPPSLTGCAGRWTLAASLLESCFRGDVRACSCCRPEDQQMRILATFGQNSAKLGPKPGQLWNDFDDQRWPISNQAAPNLDGRGATLERSRLSWAGFGQSTDPTKVWRRQGMARLRPSPTAET